MCGELPEVVQSADRARPGCLSSTPVFLIHDGGGTTFAYHCLHPLYRFVYGISNPRFHSGGKFAGGLLEMGRLYAKWIQNTVANAGFAAERDPDGRASVLVGGWSLGGLLSLQVAKLLAHDSKVRIVGVLMVDSVYPGSLDKFLGSVQPFGATEDGMTKTQILSQRCMSEARQMAGMWTIPVWDAGERPRVVLLRATQPVPSTGHAISFPDIHREDNILGWGEHDDSMFEAVMDVEGHHFDLFSHYRIEETTAAIRRALDRLDGPQR